MRRLFMLAVLLLVPTAHAATGPTNGCPAPCRGQVSSPDDDLSRDRLAGKPLRGAGEPSVMAGLAWSGIGSPDRRWLLTHLPEHRP